MVDGSDCENEAVYQHDTECHESSVYHDVFLKV